MTKVTVAWESREKEMKKTGCCEGTCLNCVPDFKTEAESNRSVTTDSCFDEDELNRFSHHVTERDVDPEADFDDRDLF